MVQKIIEYFTLERSIFFLIGMGFIICFGSFFNGFVMDDQSLILKNQNVHSLTNILNFFRGSIFDFGGSLGGVYYRPMMTTYFSLIYTFFGANAFFFHFFQACLYTANAILVLLVLRKFVTHPIAFALSVLFLVHPLNAEVIAYNAAIQDVLFFFFGMLSLLCISQKNKVLNHYILYSMLLLASILSKETGFLFVAMGGMYWLLFDKKNRGSIFLSISSALFVYIYLRVILAGILIHATDEFVMMRLSLVERLFHIPAIIFHYIKSFLLPIQVVAVQSWTVDTLSFSNFYFPIFVIIIVVLLLVYTALKQKEPKAFLFFTVWIFLGLLLHIQIIPLDSTVADRWFYFPMVGFLGIIGLAFQKITLSKRREAMRSILLGGVIFLLVVFAIRTILRIQNWHDTRTLAIHDLTIQKNNYQLLSALGAMYLADENYQKAIQYLDRSVAIYPYWGTSQYNLALSYHLDKNISKANKHYDLAIKNAPLHINSYENKAIMLYQDKDYDSAQKFSTKALQKFPGSQRMWHVLSLAEVQLGNIDAATQAAIMYNALKAHSVK